MDNNELQQIADLVTAQMLFATKEVLNSDEAAKYLGISKSYLYKLTMTGEIPHYKPLGKMCYFNRKEIEAWLQQNRAQTTEQCAKGGDAIRITTQKEASAEATSTTRLPKKGEKFTLWGHTFTVRTTSVTRKAILQ